MLDLKFIRENTEAVITNIKNKNEKADITPLLQMDEKRREMIGEVEKLKNKRNVVSKEIAILKRNKEDAQGKIDEMKTVSDTIKKIDEDLAGLQEEMNEILIRIPNMAHKNVPIGKSEDDNQFVRAWGEIDESFTPPDHIEIANRLGIIDFERAAKVSGSGFAFYTGKGATLERALINYMLEFHTENHGFKEIFTPFIVTRDTMYGTGQIPKLEEDMYQAEKDGMYLIPTAEVPITNYHSKETLKAEDMPVKYCGYSPCFRREAGSYGKDTKGLLRVHQFNKVELVKIVEPESSYNELDLLVGNVEKVLQDLKIPYRVLLLASGDTSFASAMTYDLEVWSPAEKKWLEVSSCSNFEDFQARRAGIRYKPDPKSKPVFPHTLNGSGLATPRMMVAILEHYWRDGYVEIPEALKPYCRFDKI